MRSALITLVVLGVFAVLGIGLWSKGYLGGLGSDVNLGRSQTKYQAVFLTNGQVYFGQFSQRFGVATLSDIYYLQVQQDLQPTGEDQQQTDPSDIRLIKLGNELHGPEDLMRINTSQILFVEDLKDDGNVVKAIKRYEENGPDEEPSPSPTPSTSVSE